MNKYKKYKQMHSENKNYSVFPTVNTQHQRCQCSFLDAFHYFCLLIEYDQRITITNNSSNNKNYE